MKIIIIGGGASGLMAAIAAKNDDNSVYILEREKRVGKKILATGNGRCNMTNMGASEVNYHGRHPEFVRGALKRFWVRETLEQFSAMGVLYKEEQNGKVYPYSDTASSVLDVLRRTAERSGTEIICGFDVKSVKRASKGFEAVSYDNRRIYGDKVIVAAGGKAAPALGSNGSGYEILKSFGHRITPLSPSLVQIKTETENVKKLKGIKLNGRLKIGNNYESGEILFTDYGLSGPPVFSLSAVMLGADYAEIDIMPEYEYDEIISMLYERCAYLYDVPLEEFFTGMINKRVGQTLLKSVGIAPLSRVSSSLSEKELKLIASTLKNWRFRIEGTMSWNNAQVTRGGADTAEFDSASMRSLIVEGLYACGEVLDIDGDCGGYNLQWAWSSGWLAGKHAASHKN